MLAMSITPAKAIDLNCSGEMHTYGSRHIEGTVSPGATIVDLEKRSISTPVGDFRITNISEGSISFDDPARFVFGTLDRMSGEMKVFWRNPEDKSKMARYGELKCLAAKHPF
jgi:hypothetical protein